MGWAEDLVEAILGVCNVSRFVGEDGLVGLSDQG